MFNLSNESAAAVLVVVQSEVRQLCCTTSRVVLLVQPKDFGSPSVSHNKLVHRWIRSYLKVVIVPFSSSCFKNATPILVAAEGSDDESVQVISGRGLAPTQYEHSIATIHTSHTSSWWCLAQANWYFLVEFLFNQKPVDCFCVDIAVVCPFYSLAYHQVLLFAPWERPPPHVSWTILLYMFSTNLTGFFLQWTLHALSV